MKTTRLMFALLLVLGGTLLLWLGLFGLSLSASRSPDSLTALQLAFACAGAALTALGIVEVRRLPPRGAR